MKDTNASNVIEQLYSRFSIQYPEMYSLQIEYLFTNFVGLSHHCIFSHKINNVPCQSSVIVQNEAGREIM
jgi:hypothetical protein